MTFFAPGMALLLIPVILFWLKLRMPNRTLRALRLIILALVVLALCRPATRRESRNGTVIVVSDQSLSMPENAKEEQRRITREVSAAMPPGYKLGAVTFGADCLIERAPDGGKFDDFALTPKGEASDLAAALETAAGLIAKDQSGRVLLLTDGNWTGASPFDVAAGIAEDKISIDYLRKARKTLADTYIDTVEFPDAVNPNEGFLIGATIVAPEGGDASYRLRRNGAIIAKGPTRLSAGTNLLYFRDRISAPGAAVYKLEIETAAPDSYPENNVAKQIVTVIGPKPILLVSKSDRSFLARKLRQGGLAIDAKIPETADFSLEALAAYQALIVENVPIAAIGDGNAADIATWVKRCGRGFMITGGKSSFGPGGYFRSPLEPLIPVSMELKKENRALSLAMAIAMDRSGSMSMTAGGGRTKMDLANLGASHAVDILSDMDEIAVIAVDSSPHIIVELQKNENRGDIQNRIKSVSSMGGGIFIYEALKAAVGQLLKSKAKNRHIILFADASDSEEPGKYRELLDNCVQAGVTVSVIGLGTEKDCDAELLKDIATRGNGQIFFTNDPNNIPALFVQDTFSALRASFVEEPVAVKTAPSLTQITGKPYGGFEIGGYNLCYARPDAILGAFTTDAYAAPVVSAWNVGAGRALAYTGEADGDCTGKIAAWPEVGDFFASLTRWTANEGQTLPEGMVVTQKIENGGLKIELCLDPDAPTAALTSAPRVSLVAGKRTPTEENASKLMTWTSPRILTATFDLTADATVIPVIDIPGRPPLSLPAKCLPYSPEYKPVDREKGAATLKKLADMTGGQERLKPASIWKSLPPKQRLVELTRWLLLAAGLLFLLEVLHRRSGILYRVPRLATMTARAFAKAKATSGPAKTSRVAAPKATAPSLPAQTAPSPAPTQTPTTSPSPDDALAAMRKARENARKRF